MQDVHVVCGGVGGGQAHTAEQGQFLLKVVFQWRWVSFSLNFENHKNATFSDWTNSLFFHCRSVANWWGTTWWSWCLSGGTERCSRICSVYQQFQYLGPVQTEAGGRIIYPGICTGSVLQPWAKTPFLTLAWISELCSAYLICICRFVIGPSCHTLRKQHSDSSCPEEPHSQLYDGQENDS